MTDADDYAEQNWKEFQSFFFNDSDSIVDEFEPTNNLDDSEVLEDFVNPVSDYVSTDTVTDLKTGIYSLFINLINNQVIELGPEQAVQSSIDYLEEIIYNFKHAINQGQEK